MDNLIYHYTSLRTLFSIIENQSFWLTNLRSSMDKNEMTYAELLICEKGKDAYRSACREHELKNFRKEDRYAEYMDLYESLL